MVECACTKNPTKNLQLRLSCVPELNLFDHLLLFIMTTRRRHWVTSPAGRRGGHFFADLDADLGHGLHVRHRGVR